MPVLSSGFVPLRLLRNGHAQTILPALFPRRIDLRFVRERLELPDGDFLDLDWARASRSRVAILSHGLEGSSGQGYMRGTASALLAAGWDVLAWNYRGCGGEPNRLLRFYHSGETQDLGKVITHAARDYAEIALVGFSLGGNLTLKYLGEAPPHPAIIGAVAISTPIHLNSSAEVLDRNRGNRIYLRRFLPTMIAKIAEKTRRFPGEFDASGLENVATFLEFDGRFTAPIHGFRDADDYWARSSARQFLPAVNVPTLLLNARNDPFLSPECFPFAEAEANPRFFLEVPDSGGHVGFLDLARGLQPWSERRIVEFLGTIAS
jgi:predicted alpha/beta-fold hydrolase